MCPLAGLPPGAAEQFQTIAHVRVYGRGVSVFQQGDEPLGLFLLCAGWMKLVYVSRDGRAATIALAGPGTIVGLHEVLTRRPYGVGAEVLEKTELAYVDAPRFLRFLEDHPRLAISLLTVVSRETGRLLVELCESVSKLPSIDRLLHTLQNLAGSAGRTHPKGTTISLPLTVQDVADRIGCSRQWTSKLLAVLEDQGLIRRHHGWVTLTFEAQSQSATTPPGAGTAAAT